MEFMKRRIMGFMIMVVMMGGLFGAFGTMRLGTTFWHIGWEGWQDYFKPGLNWATVTDPWNPQLLVDLQ